MGNSANRDKRKAEHAELQRKALELRKAGASYDQIAEKVGYANRGSAYRAVHEAIAEIKREPAEDVRRLELERLDAMILGLWSKAKAGDVQAVTAVIRLQERRTAYEGLDVPKALHVELSRNIDALLERMKAAFPEETYERILAVAAGVDGPAEAGAGPSGEDSEDVGGEGEPGGSGSAGLHPDDPAGVRET